jgi:hypothetical protein
MEKFNIELINEPHDQIMYGMFLGGNPNDFCPDFESCHQSEIYIWKEACKKWNDGDHTPVTRIDAIRFGIGVSKVKYDNLF